MSSTSRVPRSRAELPARMLSDECRPVICRDIREFQPGELTRERQTACRANCGARLLGSVNTTQDRQA